MSAAASHPWSLDRLQLAGGPAESRGLARDGVRMLVAEADGELRHRHATDLPRVLHAGDVVVVNTSDTLPAALGGVTENGERVEVHLSTVLPASGMTPRQALGLTASVWVVEIREPLAIGSRRSTVDRTGARVRFRGGGELLVGAVSPAGQDRLYTAEIHTPIPLLGWLAAHGEPIRYDYVTARWPLSAYRTEYADSPGSVEMPSAGRALTKRLLRRLGARGIEVAPLVLHCGVSSQESAEPPYAEWFSVPDETADAVNSARAERRRVVAVGTTVVRALESAVEDGAVRASEGWTDLVISPERGVSAVDGLITGWHEPEASHLDLLEAVGGRELLTASYAEAITSGYRWHEFGDLHLLWGRH